MDPEGGKSGNKIPTLVNKANQAASMVNNATNNVIQSYTPTPTTTTSTTTTNTWYSGAVDANTQANYNKYNAGYQQSQAVTDAYAALQNVLNNKPGEFNSQYSGQLDNLYNQIINREAFSYNQNDDVLYGLYKNQYNMAGQSAMQDIFGQGAAATGGYANTAAQSAGFNAYMNYVNEINDQAINLHNQAYQRYQDEGDMLNAKFNVTQNLYNNEYGQYRDQVSDWQSDRDYSQNRYESERDYDYNKFNSDRNYWNNEYWNQKKQQTTTSSTTVTTTS